MVELVPLLSTLTLAKAWHTRLVGLDCTSKLASLKNIFSKKKRI